MKCLLLCSFLFLADAFNSKREFQFIFPGDISSYAELDGTIDHPLPDFTLCHWSKTNEPSPSWETIFHYFVRDIGAIRTQLYNNNIVQAIANGGGFIEKFYLPPDKWTHLCFIWSVTNNAIDIFINSQKLVQKTLSNTANPIQPYGIISLGVNKYMGERLKGQVSEVNLWDYALTSSEVNKAYNCQDQFEGNVIAWSESRWKLYNGTTVSPVRLPCHRRD